MSLLLYLSIFLPLINALPYGIITNKSIDKSVRTNGQRENPLNFSQCQQCLCHAFGDPSIALFTCYRNDPINVRCEFYSSFPFADDLIPSNDTDIYVMRNETFEEREDCCNTNYLVEKIQNTTMESGFDTRYLRFLVHGDDQTLVTSILNVADPTKNYLLRFNQSSLTRIMNVWNDSITSVGYCNGKYYLATATNDINVYAKNLTRLSQRISIGSSITSIRFLQGEQMLVGTNTSNMFIYNNDTNGIFLINSAILNISEYSSLQGIAVVNETAFYTGVNAENSTARLFVKNGGHWIESISDRISVPDIISDLVMDSCQRLWAVGATNKTIFIYERNKIQPFVISLNVSAFNLVILDKYTLVMTHGVLQEGLSRLQPNLNCSRSSTRIDRCLSR